jgi:Lrp/AsnC family transcriptional regulator for asnA, asnC and gidA
MTYQLDALDVAIVSHLQENGSLTNAGIAKRKGVDVSEETVRRRIKRLVKEGLIRIVAVPDPNKLGYQSEVLIGVQVEADKVGDVADALTQITAITWVTVSTGAYDVFAWATLKTSAELSNLLLTKVGVIPGVRKTETFINLDIRKRLYGFDISTYAVEDEK